MFRRPILLVSALALAACADSSDVDGDGESDAVELGSPDTDGEAAALANNIDAVDFASLMLGAKIVGPQGPEVKTSLRNEGGILADITSYVACPDGVVECLPDSAPEGRIYTYVHIVYPGEDNDPSTGAGEGPDDADVEAATAFKMTAPAHGFNGVAGFSKAEAVAAAGENAEVVITCGDNGELVWTINAGDGGNQWEDAEPLTFFWQSTLPPAGPAANYQIRANDVSGGGDGPYPAAKEGVTNACSNVGPQSPPQEGS